MVRAFVVGLVLVACSSPPPETEPQAATSARSTPTPPHAAAPMVDLVAAYPYAEPLGGIGVPGNQRALAVQGAALAIVDLTTFEADGEPRALQYVEIPEVSTLAMAYRLGAQGQRTVYFAGGTTGLWKLELCEDLFTSSNPPPCPAEAELVDRVGCEPTSVWKRCVDVAVVEGHFGVGGDGLLVALYAASSDVRTRTSIATCPGGDLGANEVRAYRIGAGGALALVATHRLDEAGANPAGASEELGIALAADPGDPGVVYVALGAGGVRRVAIGAPSPSVTAIPFPGVPACGLPDFPRDHPGPFAGQPGCRAGEQVRDVAVVRTPGRGALLYAALEYGRVVEVELATGAATQHAFDVYFPLRVAAYADGDEVLVAVGFHDGPGIAADSAAPYRPTGLWSDMCILSGLEDGNHVSNATVPLAQRVTRVRLLRRNRTTPLGPVAGGDLQTSPRWNALELVATSSASSARLYASTSVAGLQGWSVTRTAPLSWSVRPGWGTPPAFGVPFVGRAFAAGDPTVSLVNPDVGGAGFDGWGPEIDGRMFRVTSGEDGVDIELVPRTNSVCAARDQSFPTFACAPNGPVLSDPIPFVMQSASSSAHWIDPYDVTGASEWFVAGDETSWHADPAACAWQPDALRCIGDPCAASPARSPYGRRRIPGAATEVGWRLTRLAIGAAPAESIDGVQMDMRWWQLPAADLVTEPEHANSVPYTTSFADPRTQPLGPASIAVPKFVHLVRNGGRNGVRVVRTEWLMERARGATAACSGAAQGHGEALGSPAPPASWGPNARIEALPLATHLDMLRPCGVAVDGADCFHFYGNVWRDARKAFNNEAHVFSVPDPTQRGAERWILAVASGFVTSGTTSDAACGWKAYYRRALTVFYDVTALDASQPIDAQAASAVLLGAAVGPDPALESGSQVSRASHAYALETKRYGTGASARTYCYVADLLGRVLVYDVSWDRLKPAPGSSFARLPNDPTKPVLLPTLVHRFAEDPYDGRRPNCTDLEIDGEVLYCATVRAGVHVLQIGPSAPTGGSLPVYAVLDTPGLATGVEFRRPEPANRQRDTMLVGDNRGGLHLFGRPGG